MGYVGRYDLDTIREAVRTYVERGETDSADWRHIERGTLYILNKYLFNVPETTPAAKWRGFGGWTGIPHHGKYVNEMYPLSYDEKGRITLSGEASSYLGPPYAALEAFDYYRKTYGRRQLTCPRSRR